MREADLTKREALSGLQNVGAERLEYRHAILQMGGNEFVSCIRGGFGRIQAKPFMAIQPWS